MFQEESIMDEMDRSTAAFTGQSVAVQLRSAYRSMKDTGKDIAEIVLTDEEILWLLIRLGVSI